MAPSPRDVSAQGPATTIEVDQPPNVVFDVLLDPTTYPDWLVGADAIRSVDDAWPEPGSSFHHVVGAGPFKLGDRSTVVAVERPRRLELEVLARPFIKAQVVFELSGLDSGGTCIELRERPHHGLVGVLWRYAGRFGVAIGIWGRNVVALDRLRGYLAEHAGEPRH